MTPAEMNRIIKNVPRAFQRPHTPASQKKSFAVPGDPPKAVVPTQDMGPTLSPMENLSNAIEAAGQNFGELGKKWDELFSTEGT
jgi:hypothetical protein